MSKTTKYLIVDFLKNFFLFVFLFVFITYLFKFTIFPHGLNLENKPFWYIIKIFIYIPFWFSLFILIGKTYYINKRDRDKIKYRETQNIAVRGDLETVYQKINDFILSKKYHIVNNNDKSFTLEFLTNISLGSFAELVKVEIIKADGGIVVINISSKLLSFLQLFDWGKNKKNVKLLETYLNGLNKV